jgi:hypothetical protein
MKNKDYMFEQVFILTQDDEGDSIVFNTYEDLMDAYNITNSELIKLLEDYESPWGEGIIHEGYMLKRKSSSKGRSSRSKKPQESMDKVLMFRTSYDGYRWEDHEELFTSLPKLVGFVEAFLMDQSPIPDEEIKTVCERLLDVGYAQWVNPEDKNDKYYVHVQSKELDKLYLVYNLL